MTLLGKNKFLKDWRRIMRKLLLIFIYILIGALGFSQVNTKGLKNLYNYNNEGFTAKVLEADDYGVLKIEVVKNKGSKIIPTGKVGYIRLAGVDKINAELLMHILYNTDYYVFVKPFWLGSNTDAQGRTDKQGYISKYVTIHDDVPLPNDSDILRRGIIGNEIMKNGIIRDKVVDLSGGKTLIPKLNCDTEEIFVNNSWINESPYIDVDLYKICGIK
ncbi:hypothetical protein HMPREF3180_00609 [Leptotrichia wadei]|jgi:hypothetical protein|uniref:Uncharacterized protein n=2 Tax=Leptotrichia wadei TaxID=157687 RepID=A0A134AMZ4_9FUSO|nr:hypothetical protein HMPREF3180_00609 [Leptotrichia wadei]